ncbi:MAG: inositol monophosphatase family protein [bacterium]
MTFETKQNDMDFVSFVDIESQKMFTRKVQEFFPNDTVMGEEDYDSAKDYSKEEHLWIIDPVDGTLLYKRGIPLFGIMIAYVHNGHIELSAILLPALNELYYADTNGAYKNDARISVSNTQELSSAIIQVSNYSLHNFFTNAEMFRGFSQKIGMSFDSYAGAYALTACAS